MLIRTGSPPPVYDPDYYPDTVNYLYHLDTGERREIVDRHSRREVFRNGLEDGRMFLFEGRRAALFSGLFHNTVRGRTVMRNTMVLMPDLDEPERVEILHVGRAREKNWMPLAEDGRLYAVYSTRPWLVHDLADFSVVGEYEGLPENWSGGSQVVPYHDGYLCVVHRRIGNWPDPATRYEHAFVRMDAAFAPLDMSAPFFFFGAGIVFCAGLDWHGDELCLSFGRSDRDAYLLWVGSHASPPAAKPS